MSGSPQHKTWGAFWQRLAFTRLQDWFSTLPVQRLSPEYAVQETGLPTEVGTAILEVSGSRRLPRRAATWPWRLLTIVSLLLGPIALVVGPWCWWRWRRSERRAWISELAGVARLLVDQGLEASVVAERLRQYGDRAIATSRLRGAIERRGWLPNFGWLSRRNPVIEQEQVLLAGDSGLLVLPGTPADAMATLSETLAEQSLPVAAMNRVAEVVRRSGLWPQEKALVASELLAHFQDGVKAGRPVEELVGEFGAPREVAGLIRRARLRLRPLAWQAWRRSWQVSAVAVCLFVVYCGVLWARFRLATPAPMPDFIATLDEVASEHRKEGTGWPYYRKVLTELERVRPEVGKPDLREVATMGPAHSGWNVASEFLDSNRRLLPLLLQGTEQRHLGYVYRDPENDAWLQITSGRDAHAEQLFAAGKSPVTILLPHVQDLSLAAALLQTACWEEIEQGEAGPAMNLMDAQRRLADQLADENAFTVNQLVAAAWETVARRLAGAALFRLGRQMTDAELDRLRNVVPAVRPSNRALDRQMGRLTLESCYASGRPESTLLLPRGMELLTSPYMSDERFPELKSLLPDSRDLSWWANFRRETATVRTATGVASLGEALLVFEELNDALDRSPMTDRGRDVVEYRKHYDAITNDPVRRRRLLPVLAVLLPPKLLDDDPLSHDAQRAVTYRALMLAFRAEQIRRRTGEFPQSAGDLDLPAGESQIADPFVPQQSLRWKATDAGPVIYSIGPDGVDDGGVPGAAAPGSIPTSGDWVLYPPAGAFEDEPAEARPD